MVRSCIHDVDADDWCQECWDMPHNVAARKGAADRDRYRTFIQLVANNPQGLGMAQLQERARKLLDG